MSIFKLKHSDFSKMEDKLLWDMGHRIEKDMQDEFKGLSTYYYADNDFSKTIKYDHTGRIVGSEEWAVAASDTGGDWIWNAPPPMEKLIEHVTKRYGLKSKVEIKRHAYFLQRKIMKDGIESEYWMDKYLIKLTGSGTI
jgi:hypothetical protein